jgi:hypothetical protein
MEGLADFLKYGPLGLAALASVVVLGWNVWKLYGLFADPNASPERLSAIKPLLYAQLVASMLGFLAVGVGAYMLANRDYDAKQARVAQLLIDPWDADAPERFPVVEVGDKPRKSDERLFQIECPAGGAVKVEVNLRPYLAYKAEEALRARAALVGPQVSEPEL